MQAVAGSTRRQNRARAVQVASTPQAVLSLLKMGTHADAHRPSQGLGADPASHTDTSYCTHRLMLAHTRAQRYTHSATQTHGPTHMRTHTHPETRGHMHTCVKTHPGRGLRSDAEERSRSRHPQLRLRPRVQRPEPFPSWGMSSAPREQDDQQLPPAPA